LDLSRVVKGVALDVPNSRAAYNFGRLIVVRVHGRASVVEKREGRRTGGATDNKGGILLLIEFFKWHRAFTPPISRELCMPC
jgi:hypothetical protein